jgi:hypothetical protein
METKFHGVSYGREAGHSTLKVRVSRRLLQEGPTMYGVQRVGEDLFFEFIFSMSAY